MPMIFEPQEESTERWRTTLLGGIACTFGYHFGQIGIKDKVICAGCKQVYWKLEALWWHEKKYFLPRRSIIIYKSIRLNSMDLRDIFETYRCLDCTFETPKAQEMMNHQRGLHYWRKWWKRLKDS